MTITDESQKAWDSVIAQIERQCKSFNSKRTTGGLVSKNVSEFQVSISFGLRTVDVIFAPGLNRWTVSSNNKEDPLTFEMLSTPDTPEIYEVAESPDSGEPKRVRCTPSEIAKKAIDLALAGR
jgi:hypothetical protein